MQPKMAWPVPDFRSLTGLRVPLHVVDVGANPIDGAPEYARLLAEGDATLLGFEPDPAALARLKGLQGAHETYLGLAVGDGAEHTLHVCAAPGMTSLLRPDPAVLGLFHGFPEWGRVVETRTVRTVRLDDVPEARGPEARGADLLKLDIQGGELMALGHAEALLRELVVVQVEVEFLPLYAGQPLFAEVAGFMRARGFVLHRFHPPVSRVVAPMVVGGDVFAGLSQLVWADAVFVRDFCDLSGWGDRALLAAARVLHGCYGSFDVVLRLLLEHDRRQGSGAGAAYLAGLRSGAALAA